MSDQTVPQPPKPITDPYEYLHVIRNPDGTITREHDVFPTTAAVPDPRHPTAVLSKDIAINPSNHTWARIFLPRQVLDGSLLAAKLPLIVYYHGGGFIVWSAATTFCHDFCINIAAELPAVVVSVEYRLAPEHRLPAAYDDAMEALHWIKCKQEEWLREYADFSNCFLMGTSVGGNIAYHVALRAAKAVNELEPLQIRGLILNHPFFGGVQRSGSELRLMNDPILPPIVTDLKWDLSLPAGSDRELEYCNPMVQDRSKLLKKVRSVGWRVLINGCEGDPLVDKQKEVVKLMEENGVEVIGHFVAGGFHGVETFDSSWAKALDAMMKIFIFSFNLAA
ncbi:hypothetical protein SLA2020_228740 [Shorea laevis]